MSTVIKEAIRLTKNDKAIKAKNLIREEISSIDFLQRNIRPSQSISIVKGLERPLDENEKIAMRIYRKEKKELKRILKLINTILR